MNRTAWLFTMLQLCVLLILCMPRISNAQMGVSFTAGGGLFVAQDKEAYGDMAVDIYPEVGIMADLYIIRAGVKAGLIYRDIKKTEWYSDTWNDYSYNSEYTRCFIPIQLDLQLAPLMGSGFTPYVGVMPGIFLSVGDDDESPFAISFKGGLEYKTEPLILYGDIRYTFAKIDGAKLTIDDWYSGSIRAEDLQLGGVMIVVGGGLRFGSW